MKKKLNISQFPNISRIITEKIFRKNIKMQKQVVKNLKTEFLIFSYLGIIFLLLFFVLDFVNSNIRKNQVLSARTKIVSELKTWEDINQKYKGSKDVYYKLSELEYKLGDFDKSKFYIQESLLLDPNFEKAIALQRMLDKIQ